jgi:hypothetical protein
MYGNTPDISMFWFRFWEPVWYCKISCSKLSTRPIRCGIAWDCGDSFTYKIWTLPNDVWEDGWELIRSIIRSRSKEQDEPWAEYKNEDLEFTRSKLTGGQKIKEKRAKKRKCCSEDETEEDQQDSKRTVRFDVSHQAPTTEPEEMGAEIPYLLQVNQPSTAANGLLQPNPNPKTNSTDSIQATNPTISAMRTWEEEDTTNL